MSTPSKLINFCWIVACGTSFCATTSSAEPPKKTPVKKARVAKAASIEVCSLDAEPPNKARKWLRKRSRITSKLGRSGHEAVDVIARAGESITIRAKFQYGRTRKDLTREAIDIWLSTCKNTYRALGTSKTSSDGWVNRKIIAPKKPGVYTLAFRVRGDQTLVRSQLWVLKKNQKVAVFDLDGTLTTSDKEIQKQAAQALLTTGESSYKPKAYPSARAVTHAYAERDVIPIYISGRPYWFGQWTRAWLKAGAYAHGPVFLTSRHRQVSPTNKGVGAFKLAHLQQLKRQGFVIEAAHGNATTDIFAYQSAKIPNKRIFIIGPHGGEKKTQRVTSSWKSIVDRLRGPARKDKQ